MREPAFADRLAMASQLAGNLSRFGWYSGVNWLMTQRAKRLGPAARFTPERPVPSRDELMAEIRRLLVADAEAVRDGLLPAAEIPTRGAVTEHLSRLGAMASDLVATVSRRNSRDTGTAADVVNAEDVPDYFRQDFHYQKGGYLAADSARLYDVQVETLFYGSASAMRRAGLRCVAEAMRGKDQRATTLVDIGCGTGRLLRQIRLAYPALELTGLDLSKPYLAEAERHMAGLRPARFVAVNAVATGLDEASQDVLVSVFLFHELPGEVRRCVMAEMVRVLKPGGTLVVVDSLQYGDRPGWDGLLEAFPARFHEPYYRHYLIDDLERALDEAGLERVESRLAFLCKIMVRRKVREQTAHP